jgi:hypothetical protein
MKRFTILALASLIVLTFVRPAEAGRRARRRAAAVAVVAVAAAPRPVAAAAPVVAARPYVAPARPDLTIIEMSSVGDVHTVVVKNVGQAASPQTRLRVDFCRPIDGVPIATTTAGVLPLQVNQTVRIRVHWLPIGQLQAIAYVDPDFRVIENNELNNSREIAVAGPIQPSSLEDVDVWVQPTGAINENKQPQS